MKKLSFFLMAMLFSVMSFAAETVAYTLTTDKTGTGGDNSAYASAVDYTANDITWNVTGNSEMVPWRIGGKSLDKVDRAVYTKTALAADVTKIEITHGTVNCTLNSCTLTVSDAANGAGETFAVTVAQNTTSTITLPEGDYSNKYYKLVYNVTNSATSNKYVQLKEIKFYTEVQTSVEAPTFTPEEGKVAANNTFAEPFALTIASATEGATIKYTLDGTDPALETALTYEAPITISTMVQVRAIAVKGEESSVEATATYIVASTEEKPYTASEAITAQSLGLAASVYVTGTVKTIEEISTQYGNATYNITDGVKELKIYRGKNLENAKFTSEDQLLVGDVVVVKGDLTSYNGAAQLGQNNYLISRIPAVVNYTITVAANPAEAGTVTGGGEYEQGDTATLNATAAEGYEFTCWTEGTDTVATTAEYAFEVLANRNLVANFEEADQEPTYDPMDLTVTNLVMVDDPVFALTGSATIQNPDDLTLSLVVDVTAPNEDGTYNLTNASELKLGSSLMTFISGVALIDMMSNTATAQVKVQFEGMYFQLTINMSAKATATDVVVENATAVVEERELGFGNEVYYVLKMTSTWSNGETTYPVSLETAEFDPSQKSQEVDANVTIGGMGDDDPWLGSADGKVTITIVDTLATVVGLLENPYAFPAPIAFNLTISGILPKTIYYELNGGELPTVTVPTQEELWNSFQTAAGLSLGTLENITAPVLNTISGNLNANNLTTVFGNQEWQWLKSYIKTTQDAQIGGSFVDANNITRSVLALEEEIPASGTGLINWRYAVAAFFVQGQYVGYPAASADFTEAGKPEVWGAAYQAAKGIVLPTEPVAEAYTLPTPTKEGSVFQGWYDNAEGQGEAMTVIPAGWYGTLYAIWTVEGGTTTGLDNAPVVMDVVKVIKNGQLVIIRNGVEYNANGAILK